MTIHTALGRDKSFYCHRSERGEDMIMGPLVPTLLHSHINTVAQLRTT